MKPILFGAVLALLWLVFGLPLTVPSSATVSVSDTVAHPVILAFAVGLAVRPYLTGRRTA